jgi:hypothetical protein
MACSVKTAEEIDIEKVLAPNLRPRKSLATIIDRRSDSISLKKQSMKTTKTSQFMPDTSVSAVELVTEEPYAHETEQQRL